MESSLLQQIVDSAGEGMIVIIAPHSARHDYRGYWGYVGPIKHTLGQEWREAVHAVTVEELIDRMHDVFVNGLLVRDDHLAEFKED